MKTLEETKTNLRDYRLPILCWLIFIGIVSEALYPKLFFTSRYQNSYYRFYPQSLGFFISDLTLFNYHSAEKVEEMIMEAIPENLQKNARKAIRPTLVLAEKYQLDPFWVLSVIWTESHFKVWAKSHKGARGWMQMMPETYISVLKEMKLAGVKLEAQQDETYLNDRYADSIQLLGFQLFKQKLINLEAGIFYLKSLMEHFSGNHLHATVSYNMGPYWTKYRLKNNLPVGKKNQYLSKVMSAYFHLTQHLSLTSSFRLVSKYP
jgi:soluble lytic murein transglycosylase-like protein